MVCEGLLNLFGTSSEEIINRTKKEEAAFYQPKIDALSSANDELSSVNTKQSSVIKDLNSRVDYLQNLLIQNNISFNPES